MKLAINGGKKVRHEGRPFPKQKTIHNEEYSAVSEFLMAEKPLSMFRGNWIPAFWGGEQIQKLERQWQEYFQISHALAVNSCTSALQIACGAVGLQPGDEVIVTPWSMSCSASAPMIYGATPVFADIETDYFCLDPQSVKEKITDKTKAIIVVDLFGQPYNIPELHRIANEHDLYIIEDAAQAPGSMYQEEYAGTFGHIGCFSFTQGKHLTAGEGGMIVTDDHNLMMKCALIRNHAEAVIHAMDNKNDYDDVPNMVGFNMRMTEIQAVIIQEQLKKLKGFIDSRYLRVLNLYNRICNAIPFIEPCTVREGCTHSWYVQSFFYDNDQAPIHRDKFIRAVIEELTGEEGRADRPLLGCGYIDPLYMMPLFQGKWKLRPDLGMNEWIPGTDSLPVVEKLWKDDLFLSMYHNLQLEDEDIEDIVAAFKKVYDNIEEISGGVHERKYL